MKRILSLSEQSPKSRYNRYATAQDLNFPETAYLAGPERRVYWGSYTPEYLHMIEAEGVDIRGTSGTIAEFSPKEDCIPEESGTDSTDLIMPFYEGSAWVYEGRYPTEEEYAQGSAVCLAPRFFAENNGLSVGDQVTTRLYYTDTGNGPGVEGIGADELIVPFRSVRNPMENIVDYGAMADDNTSFRIENGSDLYLL